MTDAVIRRRQLINTADEASAAITAFCKPHRGAMGLVGDDVLNSLEYEFLNNAYTHAKRDLIAFNKAYKSKEYLKAFKDETFNHYNQKRGL